MRSRPQHALSRSLGSWPLDNLFCVGTSFSQSGRPGPHSFAVSRFERNVQPAVRFEKHAPLNRVHVSPSSWLGCGGGVFLSLHKVTIRRVRSSGATVPNQHHPPSASSRHHPKPSNLPRASVPFLACVSVCAVCVCIEKGGVCATKGKPPNLTKSAHVSRRRLQT